MKNYLKSKTMMQKRKFYNLYDRLKASGGAIQMRVTMVGHPKGRMNACMAVLISYMRLADYEAFCRLDQRTR